MSRREFLAAGAAVASMWHSFDSPLGRFLKNAPRIRKLRLVTSTPLERMEDFYCSKLELRRVARSKAELTITAGATEIVFISSPKSKGDPVYHFAFNIPENMIRRAIDWTRSRVSLIPAWGDLGDSAYPREVIHFRHWNAHSLFFFDPALNLVEFIARHELANGESGSFSSRKLICASEIGLPTAKPVVLAQKLNADLRLAGYPAGTPPQFAMGDANGLLLCLRDGQEWGEHTKTPIRWGRHDTEVTISGGRPQVMQVPGYPYRISVEA